MNFPQHSKPVIGVVGGIGSGKSEVAKAFAAEGCVAVDCDKLGHLHLDDPQVQASLRSRWGGGIFDGQGKIDRREVAKIVFASADELAALEKLLHPMIRSSIRQAIADAADKPDVPAVVVDAAVLFEAGWDELCTHTIFVKCDLEQRLARICQNRGWDKDELQRRESAQIPLDKKAERCCYIVDNSSSVSRLPEQVRRLLHQITHE